MEYKDYYKIMGVSASASQDEIKHAYRKLARKYHPDVSKEPDAEAKFKDLGEAYEVLKNPEKRAKYDQYGKYWQQQSQQPGGNSQGPGGRPQGFSHDEQVDFEEFINSIFGSRFNQNPRTRNRSRPTRGEDIHAKLNISLEDSFRGTEKILQLQLPSNNPFSSPSPPRSIKIKIPKGVIDKQQIRLKGQGGQNGTHPGDLYIEVNLGPHPLFKADKKDIYLKLPISPWEAALGASVEVPTLGGTVHLKIPKLSQTGKKMRLKGRGLPGHTPGDQFVILEIVIPPTENEKALELYKQLASTFKFNPREQLGVSNG